MSSRPVTPSGPGSVWDHRLLREAQFVQLVELFLGEEPHRWVGQGEEPHGWVWLGEEPTGVWLVSIETVLANMLSLCNCPQCSGWLSGCLSEGELLRDGAGESRETGAGEAAPRIAVL